MKFTLHLHIWQNFWNQHINLLTKDVRNFWSLNYIPVELKLLPPENFPHWFPTVSSKFDVANLNTGGPHDHFWGTSVISSSSFRQMFFHMHGDLELSSSYEFWWTVVTDLLKTTLSAFVVDQEQSNLHYPILWRDLQVWLKPIL